MSFLRELGNLPTILSNSLISNSRLWNREVSTLTRLDLTLFLASHRNTSNYAQAIRETNLIIDAGSEALVEGEIQHADFVFFEFPKATLTSGELIEWLSCTSLARRQAILFALEMEMDPKEVIGLEWRDLNKLNLTPFAQGLVSKLPRHFKLRYVFWDYLSNGAVAPLFGLAESLLEVSQGLGFATLLDLYKRMVIIDAEAELLSFMDKFNMELDRRKSGENK